MSIAEAMAIGLTVIGHKFGGGVPYVLGYGNAGLLVDMRSTQSIYNGMRLLLKARR